MINYLLSISLIFFIPVCVSSQEIIEQKNNVQHLISETNNISISDRVVPEIEMTKVPLRAMIYSAILPGAGQFYNESYWKIPVIGALGGYFVYGIVNNNNKANDFGEKYVRQIQREIQR